MHPADELSGPFSRRLRIVVLAAASCLIAVGVIAIFAVQSEAGAAALIAGGIASGLLALLGPHVDAFKVGGVEATFRKKATADALQDAIDIAAQSAGVRVSAGDKSGALRRAQAHRAMLRRASVLWVDHNPGGNDAERRVLTSLGISVDIALNNSEALRKVKRRKYDCVVSDIARPEGETVGLELAGAVPCWLIYYVTKLEKSGVPWPALGITNRPDHLLHYVLDAVEREKFESEEVPSG